MWVPENEMMLKYFDFIFKMTFLQCNHEIIGFGCSRREADLAFFDNKNDVDEKDWDVFFHKLNMSWICSESISRLLFLLVFLSML